MVKGVSKQGGRAATRAEPRRGSRRASKPAERPEKARAQAAAEPRKRATKRRSRLQLDERRTQLLELGTRLFSDRGYEDIPIGEIAEAAGISKGLLYHYFPSKRIFYVAAVRHAAEQMLSTIEQASQVESGGLSGLRRGLDAYLDYVDAHAVAYATLIRSGGSDPDVAQVVEDARQGFMQQILTGAGVLQPPPLVLSALRGFIGFVEAASLDWLESRSVPREPLREMMVAALVGALSVTSLGLSETLA